MIWIIAGLLGVCIGTLAGYLVGSGMQRAAARHFSNESAHWQHEHHILSVQRDRLNAEFARYEQEYAPVNHTPPVTGGVVPEIVE